MRPLRLEMNGFTCFREATELDLESLDLFALTGRTGSGKTSILDAMIFALYGIVPRMGANGLADLISLGRDRGSIQLDFRVGQHTYRVVRVLHRNSPNTAMLERITDGDKEVLADRIRSVQEHVQRIVGLDYMAFVRSVVLPQGEFAQFLRCAPAERRKILERLLRYHVFQLMAATAAETATERQRDIALRDELLRNSFAGVTVEAKGALEDELRALREAIEGGAAELGRQREVLHDMQQRRAHAERLGELRKQQAALISESAQIEEATVGLRRAVQADKVAPLVERHASATQRVEAARSESATAGERLQGLDTQLDEVRVQLQELDVRGEALPEPAAVPEVLAAIADDRDELIRCERAITVLQEQIDALQTTGVSRRAAQTEARDELAKLREALRGDGYDGAFHQRLRSSRDEAVELRQTRTNAQATDKQVHEQRERVARLKEAAVECAQTHAQAEGARVTAEEQYQHLAASLREQQERARAHALRAALCDGDSCPVCEQTVHTVPPAADSAIRDEIEARAASLDTARVALEAARALASRAEAEAIAAQHAHQSASNDLDEFLERAAQAHASLERDAQRVVAVLARHHDPQRNPEEVLIELVTRLDEQRASRALKEHRERDLESELERLEIDAERADERLQDLYRRLDERQGERRRVQRSVDARASQLGLAADQDVTVIEQKIAEITQWLERVRGARARAAELATARAVAQAASEEAQRRLQLSLTDQEAEAATLQQVLQDAEFSSAEDARSAVLDEHEKVALRKRISAHEVAMSNNAVDIEEALAAAGNEAVEEGAFAALKEEVARCAQEHEERVGQVGALQERLLTLASRLAARQAQEAALTEAREHHRVYSELAQDLQIHRFRAWLLQEAFDKLAAGASHRLLELTGRYTLDYDGEHFGVIDHDNAAERRPASTLSGGETFLCSLALALELSAQIQLSAGAVVLESLFIDEGFGTLDPESLETVAEAIETLPRSGRLVGVITHIDDLSRRMPHRIEITKAQSGSTIHHVTA